MTEVLTLIAVALAVFTIGMYIFLIIRAIIRDRNYERMKKMVREQHIDLLEDIKKDLFT